MSQVSNPTGAAVPVANTTPETPSERPELAPSKIANGGGFHPFRWIKSLFGKKNEEESICYSVDTDFFIWAIMLVSFLAALLETHWTGTAVFCGWSWLIVGAYTLALVFGELNFWRLSFWVGTIALVYLIIRYPLGWLGIVPGLSAWLSRLAPQANADMYVLAGIGFGYLFIRSLAKAFAQGRKTLTPNSIEEWHFGKGSEIQDRGGLRFKTDYRDLLETVLGFGAGDLLAYDRANRVVKRYSNVLFLFFKWPKLDRILHQRYAVVDNVAHDAINVHEVHDVHSADDNTGV
jgi:hypothetical protein